MKGSIKNLTIKGFKSIRSLESFELKPLNIIIGANGAGKSNFVQVFRLLMEMTRKNLTKYILTNGGADSFLNEGFKQTQSIKMQFEFESHSDNRTASNFYRFELIPTNDERFLIYEERKYGEQIWRNYGESSLESKLVDYRNEPSADNLWNGVGYFVFEAISNWMVYHFHDTSSNSPLRRSEIIQDNFRLRGDGSNIASLLYRLKNESFHETEYQEIVEAIRIVIPFFDDFRLDVEQMGEAQKVRLSWQQKGSDYPFQPYHLSDGSIRFICLATALLQPNPPSTIIIDEPELGLHPEAIVVLSDLIKVASQKTQVIIATQSPALIDQFAVNDIVVIDRAQGASTFKRYNGEDFSEWLRNYSLGELWTKNIISGGPVYE